MLPDYRYTLNTYDNGKDVYKAVHKLHHCPNMAKCKHGLPSY